MQLLHTFIRSKPFFSLLSKKIELGLQQQQCGTVGVYGDATCSQAGRKPFLYLSLSHEECLMSVVNFVGRAWLTEEEEEEGASFN